MRSAAFELRGHVDLVRVGYEVDQRSLFEVEQRRSRVSVASRELLAIGQPEP